MLNFTTKNRLCLSNQEHPFLLFVSKKEYSNRSVPSQLRCEIHSKSPSVMAFCLVCLGLLAKNMPKTPRGYYLLNSYLLPIFSLFFILRFFKHPQFCTFWAGIHFHLLIRRENRLSCNHFSLWYISAYTHRKIRRTGTWILIRLEIRLDNPVF